MKEYQLRVIAEKAALDEKRVALMEFKNSITFTRLSSEQQELLNTQGHIMTMYSAVLGARMDAFINGS